MRCSKRILGKVGIKAFEFEAFQLDLFRIPGLMRQQENLVRRSYRLANKLARQMGEKPKVYKRINDRNIVEEIT
jgi:hypothetical protein